MIETMIDVSGLKKSYKANHVLKDVSFTVRKGSVFALLGSNGAGKTTVVKILSTLMRSDSGKATIQECSAPFQRRCLARSLGWKVLA